APAAAVTGVASDLLLEPRDAVLDLADFLAVQAAAVASIAVQAALDVARFLVAVAILVRADQAALRQPAEVALDLVDPHLQRTDIATIIVAISVAIGRTVTGLRLRVILRCGRCRERYCCTGGSKRN